MRAGAACTGSGCVAERHSLAGMRFARAPSHVRDRGRAFGPIRDPRVAYAVLEPLARGQSREHAWSLVLDDEAFLRDVDLINVGGRDRVAVDYRDAMHAAKSEGCRYMVFAHSHTDYVDGWAHPSGADVALTQNLTDECARSGLVLLDHLIVGIDQFYSFMWRSLWRVR